MMWDQTLLAVCASTYTKTEIILVLLLMMVHNFKNSEANNIFHFSIMSFQEHIGFVFMSKKIFGMIVHPNYSYDFHLKNIFFRHGKGE